MITVKRMQRLEKRAEKRGMTRLQLMEFAGRNIAQALEHKMRFLKPHPKIMFVCHHGNNGGDGFAAARYLAQGVEGDAIAVLFIGDEDRFTKEARINFDRLRHIRRVSIVKTQQPTDRQLAAADVIVDCIFGTGFAGKLDEHMQQIIMLINHMPATRISIDVPSGIDAKGRPSPISIDADLTIALHDDKPGCDPQKTRVVGIGL